MRLSFEKECVLCIYVYCLTARVKFCNKEICRILPTMKIHIPAHRVLYGTIIECLWIDPHVHGADRYFPKHFLQHVLALHEDFHRIDRRYPDFGVIELYVFLYLLERAQLARLVQRLLDQLLKNFEVRRQISTMNMRIWEHFLNKPEFKEPSGTPLPTET